MLLPLLAVILLSCASPRALAQPTRPFPATALRGVLVVTAPPEILLNGEPARLSPGSRIRGPNNLLVLSASLVNQNLLVHYTLQPGGLIHDVWILSPEEAARKPWPSTPAEAQRWQFDAAAQTWTRR